jgi:hypothetical protein
MGRNLGNPSAFEMAEGVSMVCFLKNKVALNVISSGRR